MTMMTIMTIITMRTTMTLIRKEYILSKKSYLVIKAKEINIVKEVKRSDGL